jgi:hypothetical protein
MRRRRWPWIGGALLAALSGAAAVVAGFGLGPLDPRNLGWMLAGPLGPDPVQLWLGRSYLERSPWSWPPGANPDYGMELGTAIYFADAIPLLAFLFKALRGVVEVPQYVGPWLLACGALQGVLGWRLVGLAATRDPLARIAGAGLLALQPMVMHRMTGHTPLAGQWIVLAALALALTPGRGGAGRRVAWVALLMVAALVHAYLLTMAAALWAADWLRRAWLEGGDGGAGRRGGGAWRGMALEAVAAPAAVLAALWAGGFFLLRGGFDTGPGSDFGRYGTWSLDLLAFLDGGTWSGLLPDLPDSGQWDGDSNYLGLGGLLLLAAGAVAVARQPAWLPRWLWPLTTALLLMLAFAVTHRVTAAGHTVVLFEPSGRLLALAGTLRNSGRLAWPFAYALLLGAIALCARAWGGRRTGWLLLALLAVQWIDLRPGLAARRALVAGAPSGIPERLFDPFWAEAARVYRRVRAVPAANMGEGWESIARFAARAGLPTDSIYMARVDGAAVAALRAKVAAILTSGAYEPGTLYVLRDAESLELARASHDPARDAVLRADGYWVLAPGWRARHDVAPR